jgi:hypothetical protein
MWNTIAIIIGAVWIISTILEALNKKKEKEKAADDVELVGELPPIPRESMLDYDLQKILSSEWLPSGMGPDRRPVAREYIRSMIVGEILLRVKREAINPEALEYQGTYGLEKARNTFDAEVAAHRKYLEERKTRLEALQSVMDEYGISKEWILANGEFKPKPYDRPFVPFANPIGSITSSLNMHQRNLEEYSRDSMLTYKNHVFGTPLPYSEFEKISDREVDLMIQFKDRLIAKFLGPIETVTPHPDEKYRPR